MRSSGFVEFLAVPLLAGVLLAPMPAAAGDHDKGAPDAVRRAVEKMLHAPTVRVKELASTPGGDQYAAALRELFDLDPAAAESVAAVRQPPPESGGRS